MLDDPIEGAGPCVCGEPTCPCGKCHGLEWAWVGPSYADKAVPGLTLEQAAAVQAAGPEAVALVDWQLHVQRASAVNSVYPCRACNTDRFYRWRDGHYGGDQHNRATCTGCQDDLAPRRRRVHA